jgi:hypothetical protein
VGEHQVSNPAILDLSLPFSYDAVLWNSRNPTPG